MAIIKISVPESTAQQFEALSAQQQLLLSQLVTDCLAETSNLLVVMDYLSFKANRRPQANSYDTAIIKAIGPDLFFNLIAPKEPLPIPDFGFTDAEWDDMEKQLRENK